jgi:hypothetical protein
VVGWSSHSSLSNIGYLTLRTGLARIIKFDFTYVNGMTGPPVLAFTCGHLSYRLTGNRLSKSQSDSRLAVP